MTFEPAPWLIATAAFPVLGAVGALIGDLARRPVWGHAAARLGSIGGCLCGAVLAVLLIGGESPLSPSVRASLWSWFSFSSPRPLAMVFGFEATWWRTCLVSAAGGLTLLAQWNVDSRTDDPLAESLHLLNSLFYAAATIFVFAPNQSQAFLGWGAASLFAGALIRLGRTRVESQQSWGDTPIGSRRTIAPRPAEAFQTRLNRGLKIIARVLPFLERVCLDGVWGMMTKQLPNWLGEQAEVIEDSSVSIQLLATVLGSSAVMLTWLL